MHRDHHDLRRAFVAFLLAAITGFAFSGDLAAAHLLGDDCSTQAHGPR